MTITEEQKWKVLEFLGEADIGKWGLNYMWFIQDPICWAHAALEKTGCDWGMDKEASLFECIIHGKHYTLKTANTFAEAAFNAVCQWIDLQSRHLLELERDLSKRKNELGGALQHLRRKDCRSPQQHAKRKAVLAEMASISERLRQLRATDTGEEKKK